MKRAAVLLLLVLSLAACTYDAEFAQEYNTKLEEANSLIAEHDELVQQINANVNDEEVYLQHLRTYIEWVEKNRETLTDFRLFIETNHAKIEQLGVNPDYVRDNLVNALDMMQQNELKFRGILAASE